jgi:hypothetical protein
MTGSKTGAENRTMNGRRKKIDVKRNTKTYTQQELWNRKKTDPDQRLITRKRKGKGKIKKTRSAVARQLRVFWLKKKIFLRRSRKPPNPCLPLHSGTATL